jgi:hypothetical protein
MLVIHFNSSSSYFTQSIYLFLLYIVSLHPNVSFEDFVVIVLLLFIQSHVSYAIFMPLLDQDIIQLL